MASAALGLTPRRLMLLSAALLLLLLPAASAQEPSAMSCSVYTNKSCEECLRNVSVCLKSKTHMRSSRAAGAHLRQTLRFRSFLEVPSSA
ncbi:hypothetical protein LEMLEM_LOCUS13848 [Lemmus lemmus]